jgi:predicted ATPase
MIDTLLVSNFKSLVDISLSMPKFTVLIGANGSGKTTILQAFDFISQLMEGDFEKWLDDRGWTVADIASKFSPNSNISTGVVYSGAAEDLFWYGSFNRKEMACLSESVGVWRNKNWNSKIVKVSDRHYKVGDKDSEPVKFSYQGSIMSQLIDEELTPELIEFRDYLRHIRSLELLSPHLMRQRTRDSANDIGSGGEKLSSFLYSFKDGAKTELLGLLKKFYPTVMDFKSTPTKGGWKRLSITEDFTGKLIESEVRHINDGLLRILAILAQTTTDKSLLLFDEIENGINPEIVESLVNILVSARQQIVVTTHSPMILNYLDDDTAKESVIFVYKTPQGATRVRPFFSIPGIGDKLDVMGAGEAFVDTDLFALTARCVQMDDEDERAKQEAAEKRRMKAPV